MGIGSLLEMGSKHPPLHILATLLFWMHLDHVYKYPTLATQIWPRPVWTILKLGHFIQPTKMLTTPQKNVARLEESMFYHLIKWLFYVGEQFSREEIKLSDTMKIPATRG